jgi:hypothetical protein
MYQLLGTSDEHVFIAHYSRGHETLDIRYNYNLVILAPDIKGALQAAEAYVVNVPIASVKKTDAVVIRAGGPAGGLIEADSILTRLTSWATRRLDKPPDAFQQQEMLEALERIAGVVTALLESYRRQ